jgi:hypothetical protein
LRVTSEALITGASCCMQNSSSSGKKQCVTQGQCTQLQHQAFPTYIEAVASCMSA